MKFDITQQSPFSTLVTLLVMSTIGMCVLLQITPVAENAYVSESLLGGFVTNFQLTYPVASAILAAILIFWSSVQLGYAISAMKLLRFSTSIHLYVISTLLWCSVLGDDFLLATTIATIASYAMGSLLRAVDNLDLSYIFNTSMALSLMLTLYTPTIVLWIFAPFILLLMEVTFREMIILAVGLLLPTATVVYIYWLTGADFLATAEGIYTAFLRPTALFEMETIPLLRASIVALALLLSILSLVWFDGNLHRMQTRLTLTVFVAVAALMSIFAPSANLLSVALLAPSLAVLTAFAVVNLRGHIANTIYFVLWILLLAAMFIPIDLPL